MADEPVDKTLVRKDLDDYTRGLLDGVARFAYSSSENWAEPGCSYVGTTGKRLQEAHKEILIERGYGA